MVDLKNELLDIFYLANQKFLKKNMMNILNDTSERNWCALLGYEIDRIIENSKFNKYFCDVEYNRNCGELKTIINNKGLVVNVVCDLIVHSRGTLEKDNLIAIEMKKESANERDKESDRNRLKCLTKQNYNDVWIYGGKVFPKDVCLYEIGIFYIIDIVKKIITLEIYSNSKLINIEENSFEYFMNYKVEV